MFKHSDTTIVDHVSHFPATFMFDYLITIIFKSKTFKIIMTCLPNRFMNECGRSKADQSLYGLLEPQSIQNAKERRQGITKAVVFRSLLASVSSIVLRI